MPTTQAEVIFLCTRCSDLAECESYTWTIYKKPYLSTDALCQLVHHDSLIHATNRPSRIRRHRGSFVEFRSRDDRTGCRLPGPFSSVLDICDTPQLKFSIDFVQTLVCDVWSRELLPVLKCDETGSLSVGKEWSVSIIQISAVEPQIKCHGR